MEHFKQALIEKDPFDLHFDNEKYTWSKKHEDNNFTKERLDSVLANNLRKDFFTYVKIIAYY